MVTTTILFVRHGPTSWNAARRIQGHTDVPLSAVGRKQVSLQSVPPEYQDANWTSSPLQRAVQTAQIMGCENPSIEPLLLEMHWGEWEGLTLQELRQRKVAFLGQPVLSTVEIGQVHVDDT